MTVSVQPARISAPLNCRKGSRESLLPVKSRRDESVDTHERSRRPIGRAEIATPCHTNLPLPVLPVIRTKRAPIRAYARARAALGYADERQIKMHNPGKSFRIFHNGREISLLAARAIHLSPFSFPLARRRCRAPSLAQTLREFVGDRALRAHTNGKRQTDRQTEGREKER